MVKFNLVTLLLFKQLKLLMFNKLVIVFSINKLAAVALTLIVHLFALAAIVTSSVAYALPTEARLTGDPSRGKTKTETCVACHGADGNSSVTMWPKIAGQHQSYLLTQMLEFQKGAEGRRNDPSMYGILQGLTTQDLADLAAYYAQQTMSDGTAKAALVALGETIYRGGNPKSGVPACIACHNANGKGNELANFPRLSGQHAEYTALQLKNYKNKVRTNDANGIMQDIAMRLTDAEIEAVSSYVEGLH